MDFVSYVDEVVKEYKRMRILDIADPKYIDDIYKIVKTNCSYFMTEEEIKEPQKTEFFQKAPQIEDLE